MRKASRFSGDLHETPRVARPGHRPGDRPADDRRSVAGLPLWDIEDVSAHLRIPVSAIYKMTCKNAGVRIPHIRIGGRLRFRQRDIDQWLSLQTITNLEALERLRQRAQKVTHGNDP